MTTALDALRTALYGLSLSSASDASDDARHIEQALSRAGYLIVPAGSVHEVGRSSFCAGEHVLILDGLTAEQARDAAAIVGRHDMRTESTKPQEAV